jgi:acetylornithine deacetylase/succinyl-diaminopimelate desuccinylase-like protein
VTSSSIVPFIDAMWDDQIVPTLTEYIRIPNKSPAFDPQWAANGYMDRAVSLFAGWARAHLGSFPGAQLEVVRLPARTPLLLIEIPGTVSGTVLLYGHLDKQPEMVGWTDGAGPWQPILKDDRLYGRGGADDGYAMFGALAALLALRQAGQPHARCVILIEACEESGSPDLPAYIEHLGPRLGVPDLVVCLDSGAGNYEQLWLTTSLRGLVIGTLSVRVLEQGQHSGAASGIVPSSFRILRALLSRIEEEGTGRVLLPEFHAAIPSERRDQAARAAAILGDSVWAELPWHARTQPMAADAASLILARTWQPQLAITALEGYPTVKDGGNVLLPYTAAKLSMRVPPGVDSSRAAAALKRTLERDPPYGAGVSFELSGADDGWNAPPLAPWLERSLDAASEAHYGRPAAYQGEGGSIPFMAMLGRKFPQTQFVITGVLGPHSNAHGPNEFLHVGYARKLTGCIAAILGDHARRPDSLGTPADRAFRAGS